MEQMPISCIDCVVPRPLLNAPGTCVRKHCQAEQLLCYSEFGWNYWVKKLAGRIP